MQLLRIVFMIGWFIDSVYWEWKNDYAHASFALLWALIMMVGILYWTKIDERN